MKPSDKEDMSRETVSMRISRNKSPSTEENLKLCEPMLKRQLLKSTLKLMPNKLKSKPILSFKTKPSRVRLWLPRQKMKQRVNALLK